MDAQQFLAEFGHIANAPGGVARLRELVLSLAFKGELCTPSDESSNALLDDIERQRLDFNGETRKQRLTRQSNTAEKSIGPYEIPKHWSWVSLSTVGHTWGQKKPDDSFVYIDVSSIDNKAGVLSQSPEVISSSAAPSRARKIVKKGTLVYSTVRPYLLNIAIIDRDFDFEPIASTAFAIVHPWGGISGRYLYFYLRSPIFVRYVESVQIGMAYPAISDEKFYSGMVPLPPTEEQSRIVTKVDELMALCDKLEAQQQARRKLQNNLRQSTLQAVASATSPHELQTTWARLAENFGRLFHAPEDVAELRNLILDLAANGFVSEPQTEDSDPLLILREASHQQKTEFSARELREINALPEPTHDNGRIRIALGRIVKLVSGQHLSPEEYNTRQDGIPYITGPAEFKDRRPSPTKWTAERRAVARVGDVLITVKGSGVGKTALCDLEELAISRQLMAIRALADLDRNYLSICIDSAERSFQEKKFGIAIPGIGRDEVLALPVLLPSLEEQARIVKRVDELIRLCHSLESQLRHSTEVAGRLAVAAVSSITGIAIEQEEEPMKAPQTELIASLRLGTTPDVKAQAPLATILARHNGEISAKDLWQRFGGEIDAFYAQLKTEVAHGWILEPAVAEVREKQADAVSA